MAMQDDLFWSIHSAVAILVKKVTLPQSSSLIRRLDGYRRRVEYEWRQWRYACALKAQERTFCRWLAALTVQPPDVLVGANFVDFGGCRHHMHSLPRYSKLDIRLVPSDEVLQVMSPGQFKNQFGDAFLGYDTGKLRAIHSHVFPWFIEWCDVQKRKYGTRWVHTHHNWYYPEFAKGELEPWQKEFNEGFLFAIKNADVALCVSKGQQKFLKQTFGIDTVYLPNGVDVQFCDQACASRFRNKLKIDKFILYVGRNDPVKNPEDFVRLASSNPRFRYVMIGQGLSETVLSTEMGVSMPRNLTIMGGASHMETQDAIAACSVLVVTSKREGLPTLVLEAMAHGKPVIVPNEAGCMEAISDGDFGLIYRQGDIDELASLTEQALAVAGRFKRSREHVLNEYDWRVIMPKLDRLYVDGTLP